MLHNLYAENFQITMKNEYVISNYLYFYLIKYE